MAIPSEIEQPGDERKRRKSAVLPVCLVLALVLGPMLAYGFREEVARWYAAAYEQNLYQGKHQVALEKLNKAIELAPNDFDLRRKRVHAFLQTGDAINAIKDAKRVLEFARDRHNEFNSTVTRLLLANALNLRAYTHALAERDLPQALKDVQEAIKLGGPHAAVVDTRGYIYYLTGDLDAALDDANQAISDTESTYETDRARWMDLLKQTAAKLKCEYELRLLDESLAVLYYHRGLVHDKLGNQEDAQRDFGKALENGYDPDNGVW